MAWSSSNAPPTARSPSAPARRCVPDGFEDIDRPGPKGPAEDGRFLLAADGVIASADGRNVYSSARLGGIDAFDVVAPPAPEPPKAPPVTPRHEVSPACQGARARAKKLSERLKALSQGKRAQGPQGHLRHLRSGERQAERSGGPRPAPGEGGPGGSASARQDVKQLCL